MFARSDYLEQLEKVKGKPIIKVLTGVRRCGKSTIMTLFQKKLLQSGVKAEQIQSLNFENLAYEELTDYKKLHEYLVRHLSSEGMNYIFLDEIQKVPQFEKVLDSLFIQENVDLYVTGSNAYMLSGELATLLSGRYIEIQVFPFSFKEYFSFGRKSKQEAFQYYLEHGGFPFAIQLKDEKTYKDYMEGIINTVLIKDVLQRKQRSDSMLVRQLAEFLTEVAGNLISVKKIADTLTSKGQKTTSETVLSYLSSFLEAYLFYKCDRYDVTGKKYLPLNSKYYPVDMSLRKSLLGSKRVNLGSRLETIVYLELRRRGYTVFIGKVDNLEIDFVAMKEGVTEYYQVCASVVEEETYHRETQSLKAVKDNYRKILLTQDAGYQNDEGIEQINLLDWLLI